MCRSFSFVFTLLFIALSVMMVTCAPAETRTTYPNTFFRKKSTPSYSAKSITDYKPVPTVTYKPTVPSVTTYKPTTIVTVLPTTTYKPITSTQSKAPIVASYVKNTFFKSKTSSAKPTEAPAVMKYTPPSAAGNNIQLDQSDKGKTSGLYTNTFFKKKPKASETNYDKVTTAATTTKSVVISPVKISEPVSEGDVKPAKKVSYTNTYFKAKPAIVSTQVPTLENHAAIKLSSNESSSEESSEEVGHASGSTSETSEESSEEEGASEEKEEASQEGEEHEEGNESKEEEKEEDDEKTEGKKEDEKEEVKEDEKAVKKEESKDRVDVTFVQKATLPPPRPTVSSVQNVHEKKEAKPVFLAFKKMRSKPNSA
ncbi:hypothetical protein GHT06_012443 [Daphnia sinensis]|uniref:EOG090X0F73 n=1 Tax=Daphnia sinensis TaxID=1820382 RepID=A0AAD5LGB2_9CRUS|nr:hypothetical protein GHT06_012443 [Daphnia sinensis]